MNGDPALPWFGGLNVPLTVTSRLSFDALKTFSNLCGVDYKSELGVLEREGVQGTYEGRVTRDLQVCALSGHNGGQDGGRSDSGKGSVEVHCSLKVSECCRKE